MGKSTIKVKLTEYVASGKAFAIIFNTQKAEYYVIRKNAPKKVKVYVCIKGRKEGRLVDNFISNHKSLELAEWKFNHLESSLKVQEVNHTKYSYNNTRKIKG